MSAFWHFIECTGKARIQVISLTVEPDNILKCSGKCLNRQGTSATNRITIQIP